MLEPQIQGVETEAEKIMAQLENQGLANQFTEGLAALREAVAALRTASEALFVAATTPQHFPPPFTHAVPPDAKFFEVPVKPAPSNE